MLKHLLLVTLLTLSSVVANPVANPENVEIEARDLETLLPVMADAITIMVTTTDTITITGTITGTITITDTTITITITDITDIVTVITATEVATFKAMSEVGLQPYSQLWTEYMAGSGLLQI
ncbi:hypothetical protein HIM_05802 [Hirsutella minnesotensis 3608]|uniref:Uncharacterized protein n=1 Tax=Hirsutella minnesotensis 3608 TaxID=1043627 RepID=A0A0F7ZUH9_9HYPO|nr:hypothetical protein HIM_05802 [Hirsutella minnesotensis 3608]